MHRNLAIGAVAGLAFMFARHGHHWRSMTPEENRDATLRSVAVAVAVYLVLERVAPRN